MLRISIVGLHGTDYHGIAATPPRPPGRRLARPAGSLRPAEWLENLFGLHTLDWLSGGADSDVAISTRVRLARNLATHPFPSVASEQAREEVFIRAERAIQAVLPEWVVLSMRDLGEAQAALLRERRLLSPGLSAGSLGAGLAGRPGGRDSVMINEEDHLRLQTLRPGLDLESSLQSVLGLAHGLEESLSFARCRQLGYLTTCPSNLGSGLRASVLLHLPALAWARAMPEVVRKVGGAGGLTLRGLYGEESAVESPFLQLSNQVTLGQDEETLVQSVTTVANSLVAWERRARVRLLADHREALEDAVWRAWGALRHARLMSAEEAVELLSLLRLGQLTGVLAEPRESASAMRLLVGCGDGHLEAAAGQSLSVSELEAARATYLRREVPQ